MAYPQTYKIIHLHNGIRGNWAKQQKKDKKRKNRTDSFFTCLCRLEAFNSYSCNKFIVEYCWTVYTFKKKERNEWKNLPLFVPGCVRRFVNVRVCTLFLGVFFFSPSFRLLKNKMWRFLCHCRIWSSFFFLFFNNKSATFRLLLHEYEFSGTVHLRTKKCLFFTFFPRLEMNELPSSMTEEKKHCVQMICISANVLLTGTISLENGKTDYLIFFLFPSTHRSSGWHCWRHRRCEMRA